MDIGWYLAIFFKPPLFCCYIFFLPLLCGSLGLIFPGLTLEFQPQFAALERATNLPRAVSVHSSAQRGIVSIAFAVASRAHRAVTLALPACFQFHEVAMDTLPSWRWLRFQPLSCCLLYGVVCAWTRAKEVIPEPPGKWPDGPVSWSWPSRKPAVQVSWKMLESLCFTKGKGRRGERRSPTVSGDNHFQTWPQMVFSYTKAVM